MERRIWSKLNYPGYLTSLLYDYKNARNKRGEDPLDRAIFIYRSLIPASLKDEVKEEFCEKTGIKGSELPDAIARDLTEIAKKAKTLRNPYSRGRFVEDQVSLKRRDYADRLYELVLEKADKYDLLLKSSHFFRERMEV